MIKSVHLLYIQMVVIWSYCLIAIYLKLELWISIVANASFVIIYCLLLKRIHRKEEEESRRRTR
jgi:membrane protein implicated in regulation of membrane protease activity